MPERYDKTPYAKIFKQVFLKSAYCIGCRVCEANCNNGCISFIPKLKINNCIHCGQCHFIPYGCYIADCLKIPTGGKKMKSLNTFEEHAPKIEWVVDFFNREDKFLLENELGPNQNTKFRRFLTDSSLIIKNNISDFFKLIKKIGWETESAWGLILINLVYNNPQMRWYVENMSIDTNYPRKNIEENLVNIGQSEKMARAIIASFKRLCELPC
jgi:phosphoadenosine phosphosulfate reductase